MPLRWDRPTQIPYLASQQRLTFARVGVIDPVECRRLRGATTATPDCGERSTMKPAEIVQRVTDSGLRGRGGAAFPTGIKWKTVLEQAPPQKYVTCNADEGDSGTFADRMLMEGDPLSLIEGMTIAGIAVGATQGYIYLRAEYPHAHRDLARGDRRGARGRLSGHGHLGSGRAFELEVRLGAGAYICGEETSMLESLEGNAARCACGRRLPAIKGLFGSRRSSTT